MEDFHYVCEIIPENQNGRINEFFPQSRYNNKKGLKLHNYGDSSFCKFKIPNNYKKSGVYVIKVDGKTKYVGECKNLSSRFNSGYGNISPRNCYKRGQPTNCRINKKIMCETKNKKQTTLFFKETNNRLQLEQQLILELNPEWNKTQGKCFNPKK